MTIQDLMENEAFAVVNAGEETDRAVESVYCCDLLSVAMGHAPAGCAWVTVMGNINTLAVVALLSLGTLWWQVRRAASANPVDSLKRE